MHFLSRPIGLACLCLSSLTIATPVGPFATSNSTTNGTAISTNKKSTSPTSSESDAGPTLLPAVHWDYPVDDVRNLAPKKSSDLYYSHNGVSDPQVEHLFASLSATFQYQAVVLDHSNHVNDISCSEQGIIVAFKSVEAYKYACKAWTVIKEFVLVTYTEGCHSTNNKEADQRTFWLTGGDNALVFDEKSQSITCKIKREIAIEHALGDVQLTWGTYYPPGSTGASSSGGSSGSLSGSGTSGSGSGNSGSPGSSSGGSGAGSSSGGSGSAPSTGSTSRSNNTQESVARTGSACGAPPSSKIDGLPAAPCGASNFDEALDDSMGYYDFGPGGYEKSLEEYIPGVPFAGDELLADDVILSRDEMLQKRGLLSAIKRAARTFVKVVTAPVAIVSKAVQAIPVVGQFIAEKATIEPKVSGTADINVGPSNDADTPWGPGKLVYSKSGKTQRTTSDVVLYCVDCGIKGHVVLAGSARFNVLDGLNGLKELKTGVNARIEAGLNLGIVAEATFNDKKTKSLVSQAIPKLGLSVKNVFAAGVYFSVDAVTTVNVQAQGQALVGVTMTIPNFQATLNLIDETSAGKSSVTGYTPEFKRRFNASGQIAADARLALPIALNVGLKIYPIKFEKSLSLIEQPSLYANMSVQASTKNAGSTDSCNNGIKYFANAQNDVLFDFLGIRTFTLSHYDSPPLLSGCHLFSGSDSQSTNTKRGLFPRQSNDTSANDVVIADDGRTSYTETTQAPAGDKPVDDRVASPGGAEFEADSAMAQSAANLAADMDGFTYALLRETHNVFQLAPDDNGDIYAIQPSVGSDNGAYLFAVFEGAVVGDVGLRTLHYYPAEMAAYNVSRLRLSYEDHIPVGADSVGLVPQDGGALVAKTATAYAFGLVLCDFTNGADSKVFLVADEQGMQTLEMEKLRYTVTGGPAVQCDPIALNVVNP